MRCVYWGFVLLNLAHSSFTVTTADSETEIIPPPKFKIEIEENFLHFHFNVFDVRCTLLTFYFTKCNENATIPCSYGKRCAVEYDSACKYTVWAQENSSSYCLKKFRSPMSGPVYFGEDKDPNIRFKVIMIMIPVLLSCCLFVALILFQRHKNAIFPKVPDPSQFIKEMFDKNKNGDIFKGQVGKLFEAHEVVTDTVSVETKTSLIQPRPEPVIIDEA